MQRTGFINKLKDVESSSYCHTHFLCLLHCFYFLLIFEILITGLILNEVLFLAIQSIFCRINLIQLFFSIYLSTLSELSTSHYTFLCISHLFPNVHVLTLCFPCSIAALDLIDSSFTLPNKNLRNSLLLNEFLTLSSSCNIIFI